MEANESTDDAQGKSEGRFKYPDSDQIDPENAKFLFENICAILVVEDLPLGSEFGIDMVAYRTGEKFRGVKLIPPGLHFVYASAVDSKNMQSGLRSGFFHDFKPKEILVKKWSRLDEDFENDSVAATQERRDRYAMNLEDLDRYLGTYSFSKLEDYLSLTNHLSPQMVQVIMPECNRIRSSPYLVPSGEDTSEKLQNTDATTDALVSPPGSSRFHRNKEDDILPNLVPDPSTVIRFTRIPKNHLESNLSISDDMITQYNLDTSAKLEQTFGANLSEQKRLLAEFQFAFITLLLAHVYECFERWKQMLDLVCQADSAILRHPVFFEDFAVALSNQVDHMPNELFEGIDESNNLVHHLLDVFFQNVDDSRQVLLATDDCKLIDLASNLKRKVEDKFHWEFGIEDQEDQPVVV